MASGNIKGITIEISADITGFDKEIKQANKSIRDTQKNLREINKLLKLDPKNVELLRQKQDLLKKAVEDTKKKIELEKAELAKLKEADQTPEVKERMEKLERQIVADEQALEKLQGDLKNFGSVGKQQVAAVGKAMQDVGKKISEVGEKVKGVGDAMTKKITAPIVTMGAASVAAFKDVDSGLDTIKKKTGATGEALEEMEGIMERLATTIPTSFDEAGAAVGEVNTRFSVTGEELEELSAQFIKFAKLNDTDVSSAIDKVQAAMAMFGVETDSAADVLDILNKAGQDTGVSMDTLSSSLLTNGTALQEMGFGINTAAGFLANLEKSGVDASSVMTGLKKALQNATKQGKPLNEALAELQTEMEGAASDTEAAQKATELFGAKAGPAIAQAVRDGRLSFDELANSVSGFSDSVSETFESTQDPIDNFTTALNAAKLAGAEIGAVVLEQVAPAITMAKDAIMSLKEKWGELSPETQAAIIRAAGVAAAIGPVIALIGSLIIGIGKLVFYAGAITTALAPVIALLSGPLVIAIGAAIAAGVLIMKNWDKIVDACRQMKEGVQRDWETIKSNVSTAAENIKSTVTTKFKEVKDAITKPIEEAKQKVTDAINKIKDVVNNAKLSLPKIKLPHFHIQGGQVPWGIGGVGTPPKISIDWYKKAYDNPVIFTQPTVLPTMGGMKGFGDGSGAEIVMGLDRLREMMGNTGTVNNYITVNAAPGMDVRELADVVAERIEFQTQQRRAVFA